MNRLIVAMSRNGVIGVGREIPWHLREDMRFFADITKGRTLVMGGRTYRSLPVPKLPGRELVVLTKCGATSKNYHPLANTNELFHFLKFSTNDIDIIGGASVYEYALVNNLVDEMLITHVDTFIDSRTAIERITHFPICNTSQFERREIMAVEKDSFNQHSFKVIQYLKKGTC